jgi:hypothetical protein
VKEGVNNGVVPLKTLDILFTGQGLYYRKKLSLYRQVVLEWTGKRKP